MHAIDLTGMRFGHLVVVSRNHEKQKQIYNKKHRHIAFWNCKCDCGNFVVVSSSNLKNKMNPTTSCGCYKKAVAHRQKNTKDIIWKIDGDITYGTTYEGVSFKIDTEDLEKVFNYCWRQDPKGYIIANSRDGTNKIVWIHRIIMSPNSSESVDHINWDKLDNRKSNLRIASKSQNNINIKRKKNNTSGYTGVTKAKSGNWIARISIKGTRYYLGTYRKFEEAVLVRHLAELNLHKEWSGEINRQDFIRIFTALEERN